ncbi:hypothetical protein CAPTEDRAFT_185079 [Capitella teleta]|uniref:G-protein coupled receptors family 1 profile domain-containing protein n=1 Tax=Capitella teleta TaxID=283909 RepID=R7TX91_CAPTE|nr:hypothetical protein CAPTEDRAFT_185079 [Capitella teleta]|eukprot:ELT98222.1 hypothetical protein CAPTEDRAFT_185079 [Capitella teleta]
MTRLPYVSVIVLAATVATQTLSPNYQLNEDSESRIIDPEIPTSLENTKYFVANRKAAMYNFQIAATGLCPLNYFLNGLSVFVFLKMSKKQKQAIIYVTIGLCFSDALATATYADYVIWAYFGKSPMQNTDWGCKFFNWLGASAGNCSNVFCLMIAIERFFSVFFPFNVSLWFTRRRTLVAMVAIMAVFSSLESFRFWSFQQTLVDGVPICERIVGMSTLSRVLSLGFSRIMGFLVPWVVISILNLCVIIRLNHLKSKRQNLGLTTGADQSHKNNQSLTLMFLSMSLFSLLTNGFDLYNIIHQLIVGTHETPDFNQLIIGYVLVLAGHALNFVFYALAGSNFRHILIGMCTKNRQSHRNRHTNLKSTKANDLGPVFNSTSTLTVTHGPNLVLKIQIYTVKDCYYKLWYMEFRLYKTNYIELIRFHEGILRG